MMPMMKDTTMAIGNYTDNYTHTDDGKEVVKVMID